MKKILLILSIFIPSLVHGADIVWTYISIGNTNVYHTGAATVCIQVGLNTSIGEATCMQTQTLGVSGGYYGDKTYNWTNNCNGETKQIIIPNQSNNGFAQLLNPMPPRTLCCPVGETDINGVCTPVDPCQEVKEQLEAQCGGASSVDYSNWDEETCSGGKCKNDCDGPGEETYAEAFARCTAQEKSLSKYDNEICRGICGCTESEIQAAYESCEPYSVIGFSDIICTASCSNCEYKQPQAQAICGALFAADWQCDENGQLVPSSVLCGKEDGTITNEPTATPDQTDPDTNAPPDPEPNPTPDPADPADEQNTEWLKAIKQDTGNLVTQGNTANGYLKNINSNVGKIVDNQGIMNRNDDKRTTAILGKLSEISGKIGDIGTGPDESYNGTVPAVPNFDATLDPTYTYNEYDDPVTSAAPYIQDSKALLDDQKNDIGTGPVQAQLSTNGDACINGSINLHNSSVPVNICFNRPWMLTGYAIMKIILIGVGYLQTAMLLNRAIVA